MVNRRSRRWQIGPAFAVSDTRAPPFCSAVVASIWRLTYTFLKQVRAEEGDRGVSRNLLG